MEKPSVQPCFRHRGAGGFTAITCACFSFWLPLWSSCSAYRSLLSPPGALSMCRARSTENGSCPVCATWAPATESQVGVCLMYLRPLGDLALFLPTLSQLCFFHKHKHRIHTVTLVVLLKFYFEFEKCCLKTCIQLEHHLDGTGQRDSSASKKSLREKKKNHNPNFNV